MVEVTDLEIGDSVRVEALNLDLSKIHVMSDPKLVVLTVVPPHVEKEPEEVALEEEEILEGEEAEEPEGIAKDKDSDDAETKKEEE